MERLRKVIINYYEEENKKNGKLNEYSTKKKMWKENLNTCSGVHIIFCVCISQPGV